MSNSTAKKTPSIEDAIEQATQSLLNGTAPLQIIQVLLKDFSYQQTETIVRWAVGFAAAHTLKAGEPPIIFSSDKKSDD